VWQFVAWSQDGKSIFATRTFVGFTDSSVYRVRRVSTTLRQVLT
jgi:hypothetical protein